MSQKFLKFTSESLSASYIPFPRFLMEDSLAGLSNDAKVLYALMLDRASISKVNGFLETDGTIRIYFTVEQAQKKLHRSRQCATRIFHELEFSGLICRKKQGLGKPALITLNYPSNAKLIQPKIIVCLGRIAAMRLIRPDFKISREHGQFTEKGGILFTALYHPSALLRDESKRPDTFSDLKALQAKVREVCTRTL